MSTGISPGHNQLYLHLLNSFNIPSSFHHRLEKYYILYWDSSYLLSQLRAEGRIIRESIEFLTINHDPSILGESKVKLSFRKLPEMTHGFVLIRKVDNTGEWK